MFILFIASAFRKLPSIYVFSYFPFGFEGRIWDLIVSLPDHCLSFYFTECNTNLPILLGTNVLAEFLANCRETIGENFFRNVALFTPWYLAFRCITVRQSVETQ